MPAPTLQPDVYPSPDAPGAADYVTGQRVWVYRAGAWRPGIVLHSSTKAVMVRYRPTDGPGTGVDTVTGASLRVRADTDPCLDHLAGSAAIA